MKNYWIEDADKLLADGGWHDGLKWMLEVEKQIAPGVAQRQAETDRIRANQRRIRREMEESLGRRLTAEEVRALDARERVRPLSMPAQIAVGRRSMVQAFVHSRVACGAYQVDPWPIPEGGWKSGGWEIRRSSRPSLRALSAQHHISVATVRELILQEPALPHRTVGRVTYLLPEGLPAFEQRVREYRATSNERRRAASLRRWEEARRRGRTHYALTVLAKQAGMSVTTARQLQEAHPELGWERRGRNVLLPVTQYTAWTRIAAAYVSKRIK